MNRKFWLSLGVTLLPLPVVFLGSRVLLPGIDLSVLEAGGSMRIDPSSPPEAMSLFALGLAPVLFAFLLVELAALVLPAYRALRHTREGRGKLRRAAHFTTLPVAFLLAATTARGYLLFLRDGGNLVLLLSGLVGGVFVLLALAELVERSGLASGVASIFAATTLTFLLDVATNRPRIWWLSPGSPDPRRPFVMLGTILVVAVITIFLLRRPIAVVPGSRPDLDDEPLVTLRAPLSGLFPLVAGGVFANTMVAFASPGVPIGDRHFLTSTEGTLLVSAVFVALFAYLFQTPSRVQRLWQRALAATVKKPRKKASERSPDLPKTAAPRDVYAPPGVDTPRDAPLPVPFLQALVATFAYLGALSLIAATVSSITGAGFSIPAVALLSAFALDAFETSRFVSQHGPSASVRVEVRPYAADLALRLLADKNIPAHARSRHTATLMQLIPFAPVYILVPEAHEKAATKLLDRALGPSLDASVSR